MFVHHVFFWLNNPDDKDERDRLLTGLKSLAQIKPMVSIHIGVPAATSRPVIDTSYSFSLLLVFNSAEDEAAYQIHPVHLKFVNDFSSLWSKVQIYDSVNA